MKQENKPFNIQTRRLTLSPDPKEKHPRLIKLLPQGSVDSENLISRDSTAHNDQSIIEDSSVYSPTQKSSQQNLLLNISPETSTGSCKHNKESCHRPYRIVSGFSIELKSIEESPENLVDLQYQKTKVHSESIIEECTRKVSFEHYCNKQNSQNTDTNYQKVEVENEQAKEPSKLRKSSMMESRKFKVPHSYSQIYKHEDQHHVPDKFELMEERIKSFFETEGIERVNVDDYLHKNSHPAFRGMAKLSQKSFNLDLNRSPLRRARANTICL